MNPKLKQAVSAERTRLLYQNSMFSLLASIVIAPAVSIAMWNETQSGMILIWLVIILMVTAVRFYLLRVYNRSPQSFTQHTWLVLFLVGVFIAGLVWGVMGVFSSPNDDFNHWFLALFVLVGLAGGAIASLSANYLAYVTFAVPAFTPIFVQLLFSGAHDSNLMAWLMVLFLVLTTLQSRRTNQFIDRTILLRIERDAMSGSIEKQLETVAAQHERILETQTSLRRVNELFEAAFDTTHVMYAYLDKEFNFMRVNRAFAQKENKRSEEFVGKNHFELYPNKENEEIFKRVIETGEGYFAEEKAFQHPALGMTYWDWSLQPLRDHAGQVISLLLAIIDVTDRVQAQLTMQEKEEYLQSIMDAASEVILTMNEKGVIEMVNPAVSRMFGYEQEELIGKSANILMPATIAAKHQQWVGAYLKTAEHAISGRMLDTEGKRKDGSTFPLSISVSDKMIGSKHVFAAIMHDITDQHNAFEALQVKNTELQYLSSHDDLTGLHNRRTADEILQREWNRAVRAKSTITVMMIDIDFFKKYNDRYGHQSGDSCLQRVATAMKLALNRPSDLVARYGGEEFIAILPETDSNGASLVAESLRQAVAQLEIQHEDSDKGVVTVSIGVGTAKPVKLMNYEKLVSCADSALYQAKEQGRNRVVVSEQAPGTKSGPSPAAAPE